MNDRHRFTIQIERADRLTEQSASMPTPPQEWSGDDIHEVLSTLAALAGRTAPTPGEPIARFQFVGQDGDRVRFQVSGPRGTATTEPLPLTAEQLAEAGLIQQPPTTPQ